MLNLLRKPSVTPADLERGLAELGLDGTQHVMVHASLKSFGTLEGGARGAVDALVASTATLVAPAFTYSTLMSRPGALSTPRFHRDMRVSRDIGRVPQELVDRAAALRSMHPTLSFIALGEQAAAITAAQTLDSPYRPVGALYDLDGYALLMGVDHGSNTSIHYGEHLAGIPLLTRYVHTPQGVLPTAFPNCSADFDNLAPALTGLYRTARVGSSELQLYPVRALVDATVAFLTQHPEGLLCTYRGCRCQEVRQLVRQRGLDPRPHVGL
ncbi:AAC(3) family N-acetyltransferase [Deinococcus yunweiensis]|uniref:AAC(3) family N-acetyltransferase n=1 Tax=Deinococcus yunweiensis TaxID=367282 RepID=UPI00398EFCBD